MDLGQINITYRSTEFPYIAKKWIDDVEKNCKVIALDFETTGLGHPSKETITHLALATSPNEAIVFIVDNPIMEKLLLNWLITTEIKQVWHNLSYDGKFIFHRTGMLPKDYEDTQLLAKTLLNHVDVFKANSGLKELAGHAYGTWAIAPDHFGIEKMRDEKVLKYAATDACATYYLWNQITEEIDYEQIQST